MLPSAGSGSRAISDDITGISRKSRDDGNQYWGRITGSEYDHMTDDYVAAQLKRVGVKMSISRNSICRRSGGRRTGRFQ